MARKKIKPTMNSDRTSLLADDPFASAPPPPYSELQDGPDEDEGSNGENIRCDVCSYAISTKIKNNQKIISCPRCQEKTPLRDPGGGKMYVRCPDCNCLMVISRTAKSCICPRENCKKKLTLKGGKVVEASPSNRDETSSSQLPQYRIICGYCHGTSIQDVIPENNKIRCPFCRKSSNIGEGANKKQAICFIGLALALVVACVFLMATSMGLRHNAGYWYLYLGLLVASIFFIIRGLWCLCMKHSRLELATSIV